MKRLLAATLLCASLSGCSFLRGIPPVLADIAAVATEAAQILDIIQGAAALFFVAHPSPPAEHKVQAALTDARLALASAIKVSEGASDIDQAKYDAAFSAFKRAYSNLRDVLRDLGIASPAGAMMVAHGGSSVTLPEPMALSFRVRQ